MKKKYSSPELELIQLNIPCDVLNLSDPETFSEGSGTGAGPSPDPFGDGL